MSLKDYIGRPRKEWTEKEWLQEAHIMVHSPWIDDAEREYWRDKIKNLIYKDLTGSKQPVISSQSTSDGLMAWEYQ